MPPAEAGTRRLTLVGGATGLVAGLVLLNVVLAPGYAWFYDMVFVPDLPLSDRTLGIDGSVPRAVPSDAVVSVLSRVLPGDVVQALLLLLVFVVVGAGVGRLVRTVPGAIAAALAAGWNPYVVERLHVGHWVFLLGYACLPWIHEAARRTARRDPGGAAALAGWLALASLAGSTSALIAVLVALSTFAATAGARRHRVRAAGLTLVGAALLNAAWIVPSLTRSGGLAVDPQGVTAFRAVAENGLGVIPSVLTLGGIWHAPSVPGSRSSALIVGVALLVAIGVLALCLRRGLARELAPLGLAAVVGAVLALLSALPGGATLVEHLVAAVPGLGVLRDSQKLVAPLAVLLAVAAGRAVDLLRPDSSVTGQPRQQRWIVVGALLIAPVALLPDAPWATGVAIGSVDLPDEIGAARQHLDDAAPGAVAVFPWTQYRRYAWNDDRISLDPWNRLLDRDVLVDDDLPLNDRTIAGEDPRAARVSQAVDDPSADLPEALRAEGVRWALVQTDQVDGDASLARLGGAPEERFGSLVVVDLGEPTGPGAPRTSVLPILVTATSAGLALLGWVLVAARVRRDRRVAREVDFP